MQPSNDREEVSKLLSIPYEELKSMNKLDVHEGYKKIIGEVLFDFYVDAMDAFDGLTSINEEILRAYIKKWISKTIKDKPNDQWNPGDRINDNHIEG